MERVHEEAGYSPLAQHSTAYHPQMDGQMEQVNQVVEQYLCMYCNYEQDDWVAWLPMAAFVYNNMVHSSIGVSPFFACYRWNPKSHPELPKQVGILDPKKSKFATCREDFMVYLQDQIRQAQSRVVAQYNWKQKDMEFKVGDMVYVNRKNWKMARPSPKLDTHLVELEVTPQLTDEELEFEVEAIVRKCRHSLQWEYKVLWQGYPEEAASWELVACLNCPNLIQEYEVSAGGRR
ncbi:hypothetical protein NDA10_001821 [Ustilago hordei]|uniref:Chromo domain-containing protein n=1 Tax=Ustilago hordei TaxID=120017 RepID=I2FVE0_USTHO|nr:uncharacterized protein UHO2_04415 [Ustilago hordei]KAJ1042350.1 hypothetical protein NDA10_001821 [Ustilago hordei]UTT89976.1 hypothetical protein NDA17_004515 [Ustilago hordei]CCF50883.1 uncharacterized protein UHOR_14672 [Ustilago hordei]SYW84476.1 related to Gag-pol polyprotein [Ustilago hordei]